MKHIKPDRYGLNTYIFPVYVLFIAYVSLSPFTGWRAPEGAVFHFLTVWPRYITRFDVLINILAYLPLGFLAALSLRRLRGGALILAATAAGAAVSLGMETLQVFVPGRIASIPDLLTNTAGSLAGATLAHSLGSRSHLMQKLMLWRNRWFLSGRIADWGLVLLGLWLFIQANPSLPLMGVWSGQVPSIVPAHFDMVLTIAILLNTLALGILLSAILQPPRPLWIAALIFLIVCVVIKWLAAQALLKPEALSQWLSAESLAGIGYAAILLTLTLRLQLRDRIWLMAAFLITGIVLTMSNTGYGLPATVLQLFDWRHGHLLNFNGLTRLLAELWALLALPYLLALYRRL
jgi:VanZ family protein